MSNAINSTKLEALVAENKRCFSKDLASAAEQLYALENHIQGRPGAFAQWLRIAYELNEDFEQRFDKVANEICEAIQDSDQVYGRAIAKYLITRKPLSFHRNSGALPITCPVVEMRKHWQTWPPLAFLEQTPPMMSSAVLLHI